MPAIDLTPYLQPQGSTSDGTKFGNLLALLQSTLNGLDNNNFAAGKIFDPSKLMQNSAVDGDGLAYDGVSGTWKRTTDKPLRVAALAPGSNGQVLTTTGGVAAWGAAAAGATTYRKNTAKAVTNTVAETDLLNGEITLGAGALSATGIMRLTAWGDAVYTAGAAQAAPRLRFKMGAGPTTIIDIGASAGAFNSSASRFGWRVVLEFENQNATNVQWTTIQASLAGISGGSSSGVFVTGEGTVTNYAAAAAANMIVQVLGGAASAVDTTIANLVQLTTVNGSATSTEVKLQGALIEIV